MSVFFGKRNGRKKNKPKKQKRRENKKHNFSSGRTIPTTDGQNRNAKRKDIVKTKKQKSILPISKNQKGRQQIEFVYPEDPASRKCCVFSFQKNASDSIPEDEVEIKSEKELIHESLGRGKSDVIDEILLRRGERERDSRGNHCSNKVHEILLTQVKKKLSGVSVEDAVKDKTGCRPRANSTDGELNLPRRGLCDEGMVLQCHKWSPNWRQIRPKGLVNLGNTCFLNATLQCLAYIPPLCQSISSLQLCKGKLNKGQKITRNLRQLFRQVHDLDTIISNHTNESAIAPRNIVKVVPLIGSIGSRNGYKFRPGRQEDAHEFLVHLLDAMQDGELRAAGINQHLRGWRDSLPIPRLDETTLVHRIFGGYFRSQVQCTKCGFRSNTYDPFLDLSLEVSKRSSDSIASAFKEFSRKETLDRHNQWICSGCKIPVCAIKQLTIFRPPLALCIQLKRFAYSGGCGIGTFTNYAKGMNFGGSDRGSKISKSIEFPACLRLPLSDGRKCEYTLTGIVVHLGGSATTGHYTSFVRKPGIHNSEKWYHFDDSFVEAVSEKTVLRQKDVYLLFYCRIEVKLELPFPPKRSSMTTEEAKKLNVVWSRNRSGSLSSLNEMPKKNSYITNPKEKNTPFNNTEKKHLPNSLQFSTGSTSSGKTSNEILTKNQNRETGNLIRSSQEEDPKLCDSSEHQLKFKKSTENANLTGIKNIFENEVSTKKRDSKHTKAKAKVIIDRAASHGKLEVMIGPRFKLKKSWKPKTDLNRGGNKKLELLGTQAILKWEDDQINSLNAGAISRSLLVADMDKRDKVRKKRMHLDRWDSILDQGKKKKIKIQKREETKPDSNPRKNPFHKMQQRIQRMNRGKGKGFKRA